MQDWKKVFSSTQLAASSMVMGILNENEIPAKTLNKQDSSYVFLGEVEVYVPLDMFEKAQALISTIQFNTVQS
ncbi:MAG: putative prokaryotic signal transducing protein [Bacteroidota bacterium]|jgi:predicted glycosyltransferase involved in capsule biosynthesis